MRLEANAKANAKVELLEEQVIQLKDLLEERSTQMEQQAIRVEALMAQMMVYMTPRVAWLDLHIWTWLDLLDLL